MLPNVNLSCLVGRVTDTLLAAGSKIPRGRGGDEDQNVDGGRE